MIKSLTIGIITLFSCIIVIFTARYGTAKLFEKLIQNTSPSIVLCILTGFVFTFFGLFSQRFCRLLNEQRKKGLSRGWIESFFDFFVVMFGVLIFTVVMDSSMAMLHLAEQIDQKVFWAIFIIFVFLIFFSAYKQDKIEKRLNRNQTQWWRG
jgi:H+/Cl- antiporter ClcA